MKKRFYILFIFLLCNSVKVYSDKTDTIPPSYFWITPKEFSILTTNSIKLCVDVNDKTNGTGIESVKFYAHYYDYTCTEIHKEFIGEVKDFPYEFLWDCSNIPDQCLDALILYCDVTDSLGNVSSVPQGKVNGYGLKIVLDRNPYFKDLQLLAHRINKPVIIDGNLSEWAPKDSIVFSNNDDNIIVYSTWDKKNLYFGIKVYDKYVTSPFDKDDTKIKNIPLGDKIEIYLDTLHDHAQIRDSHHPSYIFCASGLVFQRTMVFNGVQYESIEDYNLNASVSVQGTLNNTTDIDQGYIIELALPWEKMDVDKKNIKSMGLEIWTNDQDYANENKFYAGWSTRAGYLFNPSEWGNIIFVDKKVLSLKYLVFIGFLISVMLAYISIRVIKTFKSKDEDERVFDSHIKNAIEYIKEHYSEETLSREEVAQFVCLSPSYFGNLFKNECGLNFTEFLIRLRIEKAKKLLITTHKPISEIANEIGFNDQSYFCRVFRKKEKKSPGLFRKKYLKHNNPLEVQ